MLLSREQETMIAICISQDRLWVTSPTGENRKLLREIESKGWFEEVVPSPSAPLVAYRATEAGRALLEAKEREQMSDLPQGYSLERDDDGDWLLVPPSDVTIVSIPGEPLLIGQCDYPTALKDALTLLAKEPSSERDIAQFLAAGDGEFNGNEIDD